MFTLAAIFISGKQSNAEFKQGMNDLATQLQNVANQVANGFFPSTNSLSCTIGASGSPQTAVVNGTTQGTNKACIFLGKVVQFDIAGDSGSGYNVYTVVGRRYASDTNTNVLSSSFTEAKPVAATSLTDNKHAQWSLTVSKLYSGTDVVGAIGFFGSFGTGGGATLDSGSQTTVFVVPKNSASSRSQTDFANTVIPGISDGDVVNQPNIAICVNSNTEQPGSVTIGGINGQRLVARIKVGTAIDDRCKGTP